MLGGLAVAEALFEQVEPGLVGIRHIVTAVEAERFPEEVVRVRAKEPGEESPAVMDSLILHDNLVSEPGRVDREAGLVVVVDNLQNGRLASLLGPAEGQRVR